jgi:hypothetical protein
MILQKQLSRKVGDIEYAKYVIVLKPEFVKDLHWGAKQKLIAKVKDNKLIIEAK